MNAKHKVLVVDDEEIVRRGYVRTLTRRHCDVAEAGTGPHALDALERDDYDVVLLDLRMPDMDGMTVLKTIKRRWPEREVVVITGHPSLETAREALQLGACDYLAKPVAPAEVERATRGALEHKRWALRPALAAEH